MNLRTALLILLALGLALPSGLAAVELDTALGAQGKIFRVLAGPCSELLSGCGGPRPQNPILALEVMEREHAPVRLLISGTRGPEVDVPHSLIFEDASATLFVVWESRSKDGKGPSSLNLVSFDGSRWGDVIEVSGDIRALKGAPRLALTRDSSRIDGGQGQLRTTHRTIVHLLWWEEETAVQVFYSPIILVDGNYLGWNPVYRLDALDLGEAPSEPAVVSPDLFRAAVIEQGADGWTVVLGFVNPATGHLVTLEIRVLPGELVQLAEGIRSHIIDVGATVTDLRSLADKIRSHIVDVGHRFHPGLREYLARIARERILALAESRPGLGLESLAEDIRSHIIDVGAPLVGSDGFKSERMGKYRWFQRIGENPVGLEEGSWVPNILAARIVTNQPAPQTGVGPTTLHLSENGEASVVSWLAEGKLHYRENVDGQGWSEPLVLELGESFSLERAHEVLRRRVRTR